MWACIWFIAFVAAVIAVIGLAYLWNYEGNQATKARIQMDDLKNLQAQKNSEAAKRIKELTDEVKDERHKHNETVKEANKTISGLKDKNAALLQQGQTIKDELDLANDKLERIRGEFYGENEK